MTIPANVAATVYVPAKDPEGIMEGGQPLEDAVGVKFIRMEGDRAVCEIGSGVYQFNSVPP